MKTKIFLAFTLVTLAALLSNFAFERQMQQDFDNYVQEVREDKFNWVSTSVQESYSDGKWDTKALSEAVHWGMMLGLHMIVLDDSGREVLSSHEVMNGLSETMQHRMKGLHHVREVEERDEEYPLALNGRRIGTLLYHYFDRKELTEKESAFKKRTSHFLYITIFIAGVGLLLLSLLLSQYLSKPITNLRNAADKIAGGDFSVRTAAATKDEIGKLSEAFNYMAESLQKEEQLRRHLMSNIAHELRTPLTILKTHIEAMIDGIVEDREQWLESIGSETERLIKLVKGIEDITAAEATFFAAAEETELALREFLSGIVDGMLPSFREKGLSVEIEKKDELLVVTDVEKLERIVANLLSNSLKFTEKGGVSIDYGGEGNAFFVEIKDSGKGIPEDEIPRIFTRFYRGEGAGKEGLGLGLAIVKELLDVMGGRIEVESKVDQGSTFRVYLRKNGVAG